jgi:ABC-type sugar transport system permease subunit
LITQPDTQGRLLLVGRLFGETLRTVTFYRLSLLLPLVIPAVAATLVWIVAIEAVAPLTAILVLSLTYGGAPYAVGMAAFQLWLRRKSPPEIGRASYFVPVVLLQLFWLWMLLLAGSDLAHWDAPSLGFFLAYFSAWWLGLGYAYVAVVHGVRLLAERFEWVA